MLRITLFVLAAAMAGLVSAQMTSDPQAVAPVAYSGAPQNTGCDSSVYNADGSPVISCNANAQQQQPSEVITQTVPATHKTTRRTTTRITPAPISIWE